MKTMWRFFRQDGHFSKFLIPWLVLQPLLIIATVAQPEVLNRAVKAIEQQSMPMLSSAIKLALISLLFFLILDIAVKLLQRKLHNSYLQELQSQSLQKTMKLKKIYFEQSVPANYLTKIVNYAENAVEAAFDWLANVVSGYITIVVCVVYMGLVDFKLMVIIVAYNTLLRLFSTFFEKRIQKNAKKSNQVIKYNNGFLVEILENLSIIKVFQKQDLFNRKLLGKEKNTLHTNVTLFAWINGFSELIWAALKFSEYMILYGIGGYFVYMGQSSFGTLLAFTLVTDIFVKAILNVMNAVADQATAQVNLQMIDEFMNTNEVETGETFMAEHTASVRCENVSFSFGEHVILKDISFSIQPGEKVLLTGPNGQGKSTLLNLIAGLYKPSSGEIYYGTQPTARIHLDTLSDSYAYVTQSSNIFSGSVCENIALSEHPDEKKCMEILTSFCMEKCRDTQPALLSQGEKQRINIARAFYKSEQAALLLGDEIFSNIDKNNVSEILCLIKERYEKDTVIFVCHEEIDFAWDKVIAVADTKVSVTQVERV